MKITAAMIYTCMVVDKTVFPQYFFSGNTTCILGRNFHDNIGHVYDFQYISVCWGKILPNLQYVLIISKLSHAFIYLYSVFCMSTKFRLHHGSLNKK